MKFKKIIKRGHQAPPGYRANRQRYFNMIYIDNTDLHYCKSHNFLYNNNNEEEKLYNGQPSIFTDKKFIEGDNNFFKSVYTYISRVKRRTPKHINIGGKVNRTPKKKNKPLSLKACIRRAKKLKGVPKGTIIEFKTNWYIRGKNIDTSYLFIKNKEDKYKPTFEVNIDSYFANFKMDPISAQLVNKLRENGFLVQVWNSNLGFINGEFEGEIAIIFGYEKKIGFSSFNNPFRGYHIGCENILFDYFGEFDKWSRCRCLSKTTPMEEIIEKLKEPNTTEF